MASHQPNGVLSDDERAGAPVSAAAAFRTAHGGTARAVELLFTNRFKDAELYLRETVTDDPARASLLYAYCSFIQGMSSFVENILDDALARVWEADAAGAKEESLSGKVVQADAHLLGSMLNFAQQSYLKGAWNIKSSWAYYKSAAAELAANTSTGAGANAPELVCACKCGTGFFNLMVSLLPPTIVTIASWIGFSGDRDQGLEDLRASVRSDQSMSPFAAMMLLSYLCGISAQVGDCNVAYMEEARALLHWAEERYPKSIIFSWVKVRYLRTNGQLREAIECAQEAVDNGTDFPVLNLFSYFQQGWCAFLLLEMRNSAAYFDRMLQDESSGAKNAVKAAYAYHAACALSFDSFMRAHDLLPASSALSISEAAHPSQDVKSSLAYGKHADAADSRVQQASDEEDNAERIRTYLLNTPKYLDPKRGARDIETYSIRRAKERLSGFGHPVLDGLELMYIFACFDSMPIAVAESIRALLDCVETEMSEQRHLSIAEPAAASSVSAGAAAASKYSFWPFSGSSSSSAPSTSSAASALAWPVADTARLALIRGCIHSALKQADDATKHYTLVIAEEKALKKCARAKADGLLAFAHFFMGQQHLAALRFGAARDSLAAAKASSGHDLPRVLGFRFHSFEKTIAKAEQAQFSNSAP